MQNESIEKILKKAASKENGTYLLYKKAAESVKDVYTKDILRKFAEEELQHKQIIENFNTEMLGSFEIKIDETSRKGVSEFLDDTDEGLTRDSDVQDVLLYAAKREKKAFHFYDNMSKLVADKELKKMFAWLAQEELKHKEDIEALFWEVMYR
ncbi:MAG: ferritin family protein [Candidatus Scalindua sp.]|nr:ferritin family protein [Candidatus Scalindua sp.]